MSTSSWDWVWIVGVLVSVLLMTAVLPRRGWRVPGRLAGRFWAGGFGIGCFLLVQPDGWWIGILGLVALVGGYAAWYRPPARPDRESRATPQDGFPGGA